MRLEPRIEKLEATAPNGPPAVTRIELHGAGPGPTVVAVSEFSGGTWTPFTISSRRGAA